MIRSTTPCLYGQYSATSILEEKKIITARYLGYREDGGHCTCDLTGHGPTTRVRPPRVPSKGVKRLGFWGSGAHYPLRHCPLLSPLCSITVFLFPSRKFERIRGFSIGEPLESPGLGFWGPSPARSSSAASIGRGSESLCISVFFFFTLFVSFRSVSPFAFLLNIRFRSLILFYG